jgi:hypothetical protein
MTLTRKITFRGMLQIGDRVQIPNAIRWEFKLESDQLLKIGFSVPNNFRGWQFYFAKMEKAGRISIPEAILSQWEQERASLSGCIVEITLEPI